MAKEVEGKDSAKHEKGEVVAATVEKMPSKGKGSKFSFARYEVEPAENGGLIVTVWPKELGSSKRHVFTDVGAADEFMDTLLGHED